MTIGPITTTVSLLLVAAAVAILTRRLVRIPYTVALVLVGLVVGFSHLFETFHLSKELILFLFLPPLLFEGSLNMDLELLRKNSLGVFLLAGVGTFLATVIMGAVLHIGLGMTWMPALLLSAILAPTDPVSVLALFREEGVDKDLSTVVEGESVFNDGLGVVLYLILLQGVQGEPISWPDATQSFLWEVLTGAALGLAAGYLCHRLLGKIDDHLVEVSISLILTFGVYIAAERFHASGVMAVVVAGLVIGNYGQILSMSPETRLALNHFWEVVAFVINSILFLLIGIDLDIVQLLHHAGSILLIFCATLLVRALLVYGANGLLTLLGRAWSSSYSIVVCWGGLRGSIPIALALGLPFDLPQRREFISLIFGVVLLSLLCQGLTIKPLLRRLGIGKPPPLQVEFEQLLARLLEVNAALRTLEEIYRDGELAKSVYDDRRWQLLDLQQQYHQSLEAAFELHPELERMHREKLERQLDQARLAALSEGLRRGLVSEETVSDLAKSWYHRLLE